MYDVLTELRKAQATDSHEADVSAGGAQLRARRGEAGADVLVRVARDEHSVRTLDPVLRLIGAETARDRELLRPRQRV